MKKVFTTLRHALKLQFGDRYIFLASLFPLLISLLLLLLLGGWGVSEATASSRAWLNGFFSSENFIFNSLLWIIGAVIISCLYFIGSFVFLLMVSVFSCLFSDLISYRVEHSLIGDQEFVLSEIITGTLKRSMAIIKNELKKIIFICLMIALAAFFGVSTFLFPLGLYVTWALVAIQFLDYSWSRHEMTFSECLGDFREHWILYGVSGALFSILLALPYLGILFFSFANIFFTTLFVRNQLDERISDG